MKLNFEWDDEKAKANLKKHRVGFDEATAVFTDPFSQAEDTDMRSEYDFKGGVRGKHHKAMQAGYTITIHNADGTHTVKEIVPKEGTVVLEPDIRPYFPDSDSVNKTLRCLIPLLPQKRRAKAKA